MNKIFLASIISILLISCNASVAPRDLCKTCTTTIARVEKSTGKVSVISITDTTDRYIKELIRIKMYDMTKGMIISSTICDQAIIAQFVGTKSEIEESKYPNYWIRFYYDCK